VSTLQELLAWGTSLLAEGGNPSPALDAALFLAEASGIPREKLYISPLVLGEDQRSLFFSFIERRRNREPAAYILGRREFWGLDFTLGPGVLIPRPDTETLVEAALAVIRAGFPPSGSPPPPGGGGPSLLDLCTGSGAVAVALKHTWPALEAWGTDLSPEALGCARRNARRLLGEGAVRFLEGDLFEALRGKAAGEDPPPAPPRRFTLITANPPYIPRSMIPALEAEIRREPVLALDGGPGGLDLIRRIIAGAPPRLEAGGTLLMEADPSQMARTVRLMEKRGFGTLRIHRDLAGRDRVIQGTLPSPAPPEADRPPGNRRGGPLEPAFS
jgi:release factor glutamine methyltransferase